MSNYFGWYPRRRGILEHLDKGFISLLDLAVHDFLCLIADHRTGVAWASSEKIYALCPLEINSRAIRRSLAKMEEIGWLKRFRVRGRRGNYPIIIARYFVRDASGNWMSVNAERTTDLSNIQFDVVRDPSFLASETVRDPVPEPVSEVSGIQYIRSEKARSKKENPERADALPVKQVKKDFENPKIPDPRFQQIKDVFLEEYERRFHVKADFDSSDGKELSRFLKRRSESVDTLTLWLKNAFESNDIPPTWERFRLREWCGRAAKFANGPLVKKAGRPRGANLDNTAPGKFDGLIV
jgi:hypothetical protein